MERLTFKEDIQSCFPSTPIEVPFALSCADSFHLPYIFCRQRQDGKKDVYIHTCYIIWLKKLMCLEIYPHGYFSQSLQNASQFTKRFQSFRTQYDYEDFLSTTGHSLGAKE